MNEQCIDGHVGVLCAVCAPLHVRTGGVCTKCGENIIPDGTTGLATAATVPAAFNLDQNTGDSTFGISVAISSEFAIVGAYNDKKAFIFKNTGGTWGTTAAANLDQNTGDHTFGRSVAISSEFAIVSSVCRWMSFQRCKVGNIFIRNVEKSTRLPQSRWQNLRKLLNSLVTAGHLVFSPSKNALGAPKVNTSLAYPFAPINIATAPPKE